MVLVQRNVLLLVLQIHRFGPKRSCALTALDQFMLLQFFPSHLPNDLKLLPLLKLHNAFFDLVILGLFMHLSTFLDCLSDLVEPADDIFCDFQLQLVDVFILHVFYGCTDEVFIDAFAEEWTSLQDESHLLFGQKICSGVVLIQQELTR